MDIGLIDDNRRLTNVGKALLAISESNDFGSDNHFEVPKDSFIYLKQLLKTSCVVDGNTVRPLIVLLYLLSKLGELSADEFTYLLPLCTSKETTDEIIACIDRVAAEVNRDFKDCEDVPVVLRVLNGAIVFTGELLQRLDFNCELVSIKLSSYQGTKSTGTVLNILGLTADITGRRVIICEDIVDTGNTITALKEMLLAKGAKDVRICTMLLKPDVYDKPDKIDYVGKEIPNAFILGFGLDYDELGRNSKDIYVIDE